MAAAAMDKQMNLRKEDLLRSPISLSPVSSRRISLRSSGSSEKDRQRRLHSPGLRLGPRKRAASNEHNSDDSPSRSVFELNLNSPQPESGGARDAGNHVCLCQPDPKVPRPRNAFILYRQHYQGQVIAQNPGLANPEISKIIGAQWRDQPDEVKNDWKRLAEEEKIRHQRQYPDYRYQPRRAGKSQQPQRTTAQEDPYKCSKCNGRFISQTGTPLTALAPPPTPQQASIKHLRDRTLPLLTQINEEVMEHKRPYSPHEGTSARGPSYQQHRHAGPPGHPQEPLHSPRGKRQRVDVGPHPFSPSVNGPQSSRLSVMHSSSAFPERTYAHHVSQERRMQPPPFPTPSSSKFQQPDTPRYAPLSRNMDDVHLPPLRTAVAQTVDSAPAPLNRSMSVSASKSIEAMVMSIPFLNKIRVLSKIAPPLQAPGPASPVNEIRGPVIAVEGPDPKLVAEVGRYIEDYLSKEGGVTIRTWSEDATPTVSRKHPATVSDENKSAAGSGGSREITPPPDANQPPILSYLDSIRAWHPRSSEIRKFITTIPPFSSSSTSSLYPPPGKLKRASESPPCSPTSKPASKSATPPLLPVALLPHGFSLTLSDKASRRIPIDDAYAPVDHWQWMATLWRGIIGPDLTIFVNSGPREDDVGPGGPGGLGGQSARIGGLAQGGMVEVRMDSRAIVVQCQNGRLEGGVLRRAGFEVGEWVRGRGLGV